MASSKTNLSSMTHVVLITWHCSEAAQSGTYWEYVRVTPRFLIDAIGNRYPKLFKRNESGVHIGNCECYAQMETVRPITEDIIRKSLKVGSKVRLYHVLPNTLRPITEADRLRPFKKAVQQARASVKTTAKAHTEALADLAKDKEALDVFKCSVWCVQHQEGWCRIKSQPKPGTRPRYRDSIKATCGYFVVLPMGFEFRVPTCPECLKSRKK